MNKAFLLINPPVLLLIGSFYYLITPSIFYFNEYFQLDFLGEVASKHVTTNTPSIYYHVILDFFIINTSFIFGYYLVKKVRFKSTFLESYTVFKLLPNIVLLFLASVLVLIVIKAYLLGYIFFSGYSTYEVSILGPLATLCFMSMWFYIYFRDKKFIYLFLISSALLLGAGSRMFFVLPVISLAIFRVFQEPSRLKKYFCLFVLLIISMLSVGLLREGSSLTLDGLLTILFAEPIFTSLGLMYYFDNGFPLLGYPSDVIASAVNFIPSSIYAEKQVFMDEITYDPKAYSPLGAQSIVVSLYKNFGVFYPIFIFSFGGYFGALFKLKHNRFFSTVYIMSLPVIMLHFQREGFITVFKILTFNGFFLPLIILLTLGTFLTKQR